MSEEKDVEQESSPAETVEKTAVPSKEVEATPVEEPKGAKTPDSNMYAALQEERRMRRELEQKLRRLEEVKQEVVDESWKDEVQSVKDELHQIRDTVAVEKLQAQYPDLSENMDEFNEFRREYAGVELDKVAKLFLSERKGVHTDTKKGLEKPTGGSDKPEPIGMSKEDVERLRTTNFRKYSQMIRSGQLDPDKIK